MKNMFCALKSKIHNTNKGSVKEFIAKLSKGLMLPIAMLPIAGLFLGIGAAIATGAGSNLALATFGNFLKIPGDVIFGALPVLFAIAIAIAFTKDSGPAALAAIIGFLVFSGLQAALLNPVFQEGKLIGYNLLFYVAGSLGEYSDGAGLPSSLVGTTLGITALSSSIFGGFIVGFTVAAIYNRFKDIQLPAVIGFFSGIRFVPIMVFLVFFPITLIFLIIWPLIGILFNIIGEGLGSNLYGFNSFIFGYIERALVPFGLHHAFYSPLWYTSVGGSLDLTKNAEILINGALVPITMAGGAVVTTWQDLFINLNPNFDKGMTTIAGDQILWANINNVVGAEVLLGDQKHILVFSDFTFANGSAGVNVGQYMQGKYPFMMFGLPAAAAAMVLAAPKENRKMSASIVGSAGLTSFLTGITEPIEFTFLFLAPWLFWGVHAFFCAFSFGFMNWIGLIFPATAPHIGQTFSGGAIDWVIYGAIQIPGGSNAWWALILGAVYIPIYFFLFLFLIKRFNIPTPGRGGNEKLFTKADYKNKNESSGNVQGFDPIVLQIIDAYGGIDNIENVDACITKLRIQVANQDIVDENRLKNDLGAFGTIKPSKQSVYAIYGAKADKYKNGIIEVKKAIHQNPKLKDELFNSLEKTEFNISNNKAAETSLEKVTVLAPVKCKVINLKDVPDPTFSDEIVGKGVAIIPLEEEIFSILNKGKLELAFDTGHAYSFVTDQGTQILLHLGIDSFGFQDAEGNSVSIFEPRIKTGQNVKTDTKIANIYLEGLNEWTKSPISPIVVLNETIKGRKIKILAKGTVEKGTPLFTIE
ncbi:MAG: PTS transporter subunit EIIC [Metamycoplasmataceae bacterium]